VKKRVPASGLKSSFLKGFEVMTEQQMDSRLCQSLEPSVIFTNNNLISSLFNQRRRQSD
jgi:hypothetical protein